MTVQKALQYGCRLLEEGAVAVPRLTAEVLLCHVLHCGRAYLYGHPEEELSESAWLDYSRYVEERLEGKPTQYITRRQEFYGREFWVTPDVLIPRPETEHVVEAALALAGAASKIGDRLQRPERCLRVDAAACPRFSAPLVGDPTMSTGAILDVGCGSGAIAVTLSLELKRPVLGSDISLPALAVAAENARRLGAQVRFLACDATSAVGKGKLDLVVSNPPYVPLDQEAGLQREIREWEPRVALFAGASGLDMYRRLVADAERVLRPGGWLVVELGFKTADPVRQMLSAGWAEVRILPDLAGFERVLAARLVP